MENKTTTELLSDERLVNEALEKDIIQLENELVIRKMMLEKSNDRIKSYLNYLNSDEN